MKGWVAVKACGRALIVIRVGQQETIKNTQSDLL